MLEYDDAFERDEYYMGFQHGYQAMILDTFRELYSDISFEQIMEISCETPQLKGFISRYTREHLIFLYEFINKYNGLSNKMLAKRYIAESEYLPWRKR